jgi:hypothetical protein
MKLHKGELIEKLIRRNGVNISDIARKMRVNRRSVYNWFEQQNLKMDVIIRIGNIVGCDIPKEYPEAFTPDELSTLDSLTAYNQQGSNQPGQNEKFWIEKYVTLLEEYNQLLMRQTYLSELGEKENPVLKSNMLIKSRELAHTF